MKKHTQLSSRELQLLSAYLDGELSEKDQKRVQGMLSGRLEAGSTLEKLRLYKKLLKSLPVHKSPRNFTITPDQVGRAQSPVLVGVLRYASAVSAVMLAVVLAFDFIFPTMLASGKLAFEQSALTTFEEKIVANVQEGKAADTGQLPQEGEEQLLAEGDEYGQELQSSQCENGLISGAPFSESWGTNRLFGKLSELVANRPVLAPIHLLEIILAGISVITFLMVGFIRNHRK